MISKLAVAIGYPEEVADNSSAYAFRVDGWEIIAEKPAGRLILKCYLDIGYDDLPEFASYVAGRLLREEASLAWDESAQKALLWREISPNANLAEMKNSFEEFADSCEWWMQRALDVNAPKTLEYPQFLTLETGRMPDSIGQDAFSEVK